MSAMPIPVVALVTYPAKTDLEDAALRDLLEQAGRQYTDIPGLRRKYFLSSPGIAGGVYEWESESSARAFFNEQWFADMQARSGVKPELQLFESPAIADGIHHKLEIFLPGPD